MNLFLERFQYTPNSTVGRLSVDGVFQCFTLEPSTRPIGVKVVGKTSIPAGRYTVTIRNSARFNRLMPHVENVPGFDGIEIHWGNYPKDTEGCIIVGEAYTTDEVVCSMDAFNKFFPMLVGVQRMGAGIGLTIQDSPEKAQFLAESVGP
ncbi:MAG: DUF5675 family protein [Terracidiphilus sp.]|nr:DUF5675 family protein [Terracidiphilus sp.]